MTDSYERRSISTAGAQKAIAAGVAKAEEIGVPAQFQTEGVHQPLPMALEVVLLRSAQEALSNVRKHAGATEVAADT